MFLSPLHAASSQPVLTFGSNYIDLWQEVECVRRSAKHRTHVKPGIRAHSLLSQVRRGRKEPLPWTDQWSPEPLNSCRKQQEPPAVGRKSKAPLFALLGEQVLEPFCSCRLLRCLQTAEYEPRPAVNQPSEASGSSPHGEHLCQGGSLMTRARRRSSGVGGVNGPAKEGAGAAAAEGTSTQHEGRRGSNVKATHGGR